MPFCCNRRMNSINLFKGLPQEGLRSMPKTPAQAVNFLVRGPVSLKIHRFFGEQERYNPHIRYRLTDRELVQLEIIRFRAASLAALFFPLNQMLSLRIISYPTVFATAISTDK